MSFDFFCFVLFFDYREALIGSKHPDKLTKAKQMCHVSNNSFIDQQKYIIEWNQYKQHLM